MSPVLQPEAALREGWLELWPVYGEACLAAFTAAGVLMAVLIIVRLRRVGLYLLAAVGAAVVLLLVCAGVLICLPLVPFGVRLLAGLAFLCLPVAALYLVRWGWLGLLIAALLPGIGRRPRLVLLVMTLGWGMLGGSLLYQRFTHLPSELQPPDGFHVVSRRNYPDLGPLGLSMPFRRIEFRSTDVMTPKATILDEIERRLATAAGDPWEARFRAEGKREVLAYGTRPTQRGLARDEADRRQLDDVLADFGVRWPLNQEAMLADPGVSLLRLTSYRASERWHITYLIYDRPTARVIEAYITGYADD